MTSSVAKRSHPFHAERSKASKIQGCSSMYPFLQSLRGQNTVLHGWTILVTTRVSDDWNVENSCNSPALHTYPWLLVVSAVFNLFLPIDRKSRFIPLLSLFEGPPENLQGPTAAPSQMIFLLFQWQPEVCCCAQPQHPPKVIKNHINIWGTKEETIRSDTPKLAQARATLGKKDEVKPHPVSLLRTSKHWQLRLKPCPHCVHHAVRPEWHGTMASCKQTKDIWEILIRLSLTLHWKCNSLSCMLSRSPHRFSQESPCCNQMELMFVKPSQVCKCSIKYCGGT